MIESSWIHPGEAGTIAGDGFTIKTIQGCRVVFGPLPFDSLPLVTRGFGEKAEVAFDIADLIGASLVVGEPDALADLRKTDLAVSEKRQADYVRASSRGLLAVAMWLRRGERGRSSNAMCKAIFGLPDSAGTDHPRTPDDLRRCVLFLDATGARDRIEKVAAISPEWAALVGVWDTLTASLEEEMAAGPLASETYALMQSLLTTRPVAA